MNYRILSPMEATPYLLDRACSPVVSLDTEFDPEDGPWPGRLRGVSMAGGTPETGLFGCFWSFEEPYENIPWRVFFDTVLKPIFGDPKRVVVMHPLAVDLPQLRAHGLTDAMSRCMFEDTVAQAYIYDDNLPHGLKPLSYCVLLAGNAASHAATQREIKAIHKEGKKVVKDLVGKVWDCYKELRQKSSELEVAINPEWPGWQRLAMSLPPGMVKSTPKSWKCAGKNGCEHKNVVDQSLLTLDDRQIQTQCENCGRNRRITLGAESHVRPIIENVVFQDYDHRAHKRFEEYAALDAIYTLSLRYKFKPSFTELQLEHLDLETSVTHPCVTEMQERGLKIDIPLLTEINSAMDVAVTALEQEVITLWSEPGDENPFNPGSPDQVANRVWLDWGLSPPKWAVDRRNGGIKKKHRRNKDGLCSTDNLVLTAMVEKYEGQPYSVAIQKMLDLRRWGKLMTTYVGPILHKARNDPDGRVHSSFWPTGARSGRFSSSDPNVENIPRPFTMPVIPIGEALSLFGGVVSPFEPPRGFVPVIKKHDGVEGPCASRKHKGCPQCADVTAWRVRSLREIFIAPPGYVFVSADLSQIENRFTAFESRDPTMLALYREWDCECGAHGESNTILHTCPVCGAAEGKRNKKHPDQPIVSGFVHGKDIHSATAAALGFFEKYGEDGRQQGKPVNHAATYGMGAQTFAKRHGVPVKDAERDIEKWHETYPNIQGYLHVRVRNDIRDQGYVVMFDGHVRRFLAQRLLMQSGNFKPWEWEGTIREGVNVLMQGGTGIGMKRAMISTRQRIIDLGWWGAVFLVNQVHDELLYEVREDLADAFEEVLIDEMEHSYPELDVPVAADSGRGTNWGDAH